MRLLPALLWSGAVLLSATSMHFVVATDKLLVPLLWRLGAGKNEAYELHNLLRKALHVPAYALLALLASWALRHSTRRGLLTLAIVLAVALADEALQSRTPGRHGSIWDVGLDLLGGGLGLWIGSRARRVGPKQ